MVRNALMLLVLLAAMASCVCSLRLFGLRTSAQTVSATPHWALQPACTRSPWPVMAEPEDAATEPPEASEASEASTEAEAPAKEEKEDADDLLSSPAFLKQKLKVLEKELEKISEDTEVAKAEAAEQIEAFGSKRERLQADFENFKARHYNSTLEAQTAAKAKLLQDFLPVLDNFDRARGLIKAEGPEQEAVATSYDALHAGLMKDFATLGVTKIEAVGSEFDYNLHMAISSQPSDEYAENIVMEEMQPGYTCDGKLVRAAYVIVSMG